jgi:hypothetical protein
MKRLSDSITRLLVSALDARPVQDDACGVYKMIREFNKSNEKTGNEEEKMPYRTFKPPLSITINL